MAVRDRAVSLPDDAELLDEAATARMIETGPSTVKLSNPAAHHDDVLTAIGMVITDPTSQPDIGGGRIIQPNRAARGRRILHSNHDSRVGSLPLQVARRAVRPQSPAARAGGIGLPVPGSANDPRRR